MQEEQQATSLLNVEANRKKIDELEKLLKKLGDENSVLRLELEEKMARLDYTNKVAQIELEKRTQAESVVTESDVYRRMNELAGQGRTMGTADWQQLEELVNRVYTNFTARLLSLYPMSPQDFRVTLLTKVHILPKDIATLTAHSKESVASTRSRLYQKVFGRKGSSKDWDDFVLSL
jgi:regulator of replication initiation timing